MTQSTDNSSDKYGVLPLDYKLKIAMSITAPMESQYRRTACRKEPWTVEFIESLPRGSWFIDCGANVGPYTLIAVTNNLQVIAIEPSPDSAHRLCENLRLNDWADRAAVYMGALSDANGFNYFSLSDLRPGYNDHVFGKHKHALPERVDIFHTHIIPTIRLDDLVAQLPGDDPIAMKVDVDGGEGLVLAGGVQALQAGRLNRLMLELTRPNADAILADLAKCGWKVVHRIDEETTPPSTEFGGQRFRDMFYIELGRA